MQARSRARRVAAAIALCAAASLSAQPQTNFEDRLVAAEPAERPSLLLAHGSNAELIARLSKRGGDCFRKRDADCASRNYESALAAATILDDRRQIANAHFNIGLVARLRGDLETASSLFRKALIEFQNLGMDSEAANAEGSIASTLGRQGDYASAAEHFAVALSLAEKSGDKFRTAQISYNLANSLFRSGHLREALPVFHRSLALCAELKLDLEASFSTNGIGNIYFSQRQFDLALDYYQQSLKIKEKLGNPTEIAHTLSNIANVKESLGNIPAAKATNQRALSLYEQTHDSEGRSFVLHNLGLLAMRSGNYEEAQRLIDQSIALSEEIGDRPTLAEGRMRLAELALNRGDARKALEIGNGAVAMLLEMGSLRNLVGAREVVGRAQHRLGLLDEAEESLRGALDAAEVMRGEVAGGAEQRLTTFDHYLETYRALITLLAERNKASDVLLIAERLKARSLLELMRTTGRTTISMSDAEKARERALVARLSVFNSELQRENARPQPDHRKLEAAQSRIEAARRDYKLFEAELYTAHPGLDLRRAGNAMPSASELSAMLPNEGWAAIQYVFGLRDLYAVIVTRDAIQLRRLDLKPDDPGHEIQNFREQIATRDLGYSAAARRLYDRLVKPLLADLGRKRNLVIVPDGALWHLPFAALLAPNGKHLLEEYALSISPSLATLREVRRRAGASPGVRKPSLLAVGRGPSAAGTSGPEKEAAAIGALWGTSAKLLVGDNAREDLVKREASGYSIVHLAAHGVFEDRNALYSHVSLAPSRNAGQPDEDGLLEAREFLQLDWPADLVVLSACETARGKSEYAEGMVGLTWAVTAAGARTTLASQWKVDADATTKLMLAFHRAWKTNISAPHPLARAQVFRSAATAVMASPYRKHPYYWAGFVLFGDGF